MPPHPAESGRHYAARVILYMEAAFLVLIAFGFFSGTQGTDLLTVAGGGGLCIVGVVILGVGATRMRHDVPVIRDPTDSTIQTPRCRGTGPTSSCSGPAGSARSSSSARWR